MAASASDRNEEKLSPFASLISQKILERLASEITLAKDASLKATYGESSYHPPSKTDNLPKKFPSALPEQGKPVAKVEKISLEATLEYTRLKKELSKEEHSKEAKESCSSSLETFSEDVDFILNIIRNTQESLQETNSHSVFKEEVVKASLHLNAEQHLKTELKETQERINKMKQEIRKREMEMLLEEQEKVGETGRLQDEHHLIKKEGKETLEFTDTFFEAHSSNSSCSHQANVEIESKKISQINKQLDRDVHCLAVMEAWTEDFCEQLEAKIDEWKRKLRGDELVMDMRIDAKRRAIKSQEDLIKSLNETIAERLEELAPWEAEKEVERQERLAHMRRYYSCRKLQRWWRGYMVKLKLYKKKKVKAKDAK